MTEPQKRILIQASPLEIFHIQQLTFSTRIHRIVYKSKSTMVAYYQLDIIYWIQPTGWALSQPNRTKLKEYIYGELIKTHRLLDCIVDQPCVEDATSEEPMRQRPMMNMIRWICLVEYLFIAIDSERDCDECERHTNILKTIPNAV